MGNASISGAPAVASADFLELRGGPSGVRILKNDGTVVNWILTDAGALSVPGGITAPLTGTVTGSATSVPASGLTGTTLATNVTASSLTSVGVLASPHFTSPVVDSGGLTVTAGNVSVPAGNLSANAVQSATLDTGAGTISVGPSTATSVVLGKAGLPVSVPGTLAIGGGTAITNIQSLPTALTPVAVAANTTAEQLFTVTGLATNDKVFVNKPTAQAGLGIVGFRVAGVNSLGITFSNNTAAAITPTAAETYQIVAIRS